MKDPVVVRRWKAAFLAVGVIASLAGCGGGGGDAAPSPPPPAPPPAPAASRWLSTAPNLELFGTSDSGIDGALAAVDPQAPASVFALNPNPVDSTVVRIGGGSVDATLSLLTAGGTRHLVWDEADAAGNVRLFKMALDLTAGSMPARQQLSSETRICNSGGVRFRLIGQRLDGDDAILTYDAPSAAGSCSSDTRPHLVRLSMSATTPPIALPTAAADRVTPIAPIHGSNGEVAAFLAWQGGRFVRTDASLANPTPIPDANIGGPVDPSAAPLGPGFMTRYGIFVRSADGLRRYDKSTDRLSAVLVSGQVAAGTAVDQVADDRALHVSRVDAGGNIDLFRVEDVLGATAARLNVEGPLRPSGFRVLKSHVLYALAGRSDWTAWRKSDGVRSPVFAERNVALASSLHDQVFTWFVAADGSTQLAQSLPDGSQERVFTGAVLIGGGLADSVSPYTRHLRRNASFSHALVAVPAGGNAAQVRWLGFDGTVSDIDAGALPGTLAIDASDWQGPGIVGSDALVGVRKAGSSERYLFVARRQPASLARVADGVQ